jgi:hypothetical protein
VSVVVSALRTNFGFSAAGAVNPAGFQHAVEEGFQKGQASGHDAEIPFMAGGCGGTLL